MPSNISAPNDANWVNLFYGSTFDPNDDQQSTAGADLVGSGSVPLVRTQKVVSGSETIFFYQVRMGTLSNGNSSASFYLGLDIDGSGDFPVADMFIEAGFSIISNKLKKGSVAFHKADFSNGNIGVSPNTTAWQNSATDENIEYELLSGSGNNTFYSNTSAFISISDTGADLDGDGSNEWWVTFGFTLAELQDWAHNGIRSGSVSVDANNISSSAVSADTTLALFGFTSTSQTANGDVAGVDDRTADLDESWLELGVVINTSLNGAASGAPSSPTVNRLTTADTTPTVSGTALLTSVDSLAVVINGVTYTTANGLTLTALNGTNTYTWSITVSTALAGGTYDVQATTTRSGGSSASDTSTNELVINLSLPTQIPTINTYTDDQSANTGNYNSGTRTNDTSPLLNGSLDNAMDSGDVLRIYRSADGGANYSLLGTATVSGTNWNYQDASLSDGTTYLYKAVVYDGSAEGQRSAGFYLTVDTLAPTQTVTISSYTDNVGASTGDFASGTTTDDSSPLLNGTLSAGLSSSETLKVYRDGAYIGEATVETTLDSNGDITGYTWSYQDSSISSGAHSYTARVVDSAGNQGTVSSAFSLTLATPGLTLTGTSLTTSETGTAATFTVVLDSQPTADVTVTLTGLDSTEGTLSATTLTFTAANWNTAQTVTVTGVDDTLDDGDISYTVTATTSSTDSNYTGANARTGTVTVTNTDDDTAPTLSIDDVTVAEGAGTATFTVTRSGATGGTTTVDYTTADGTASAGSDYTATSGSLSFAPGETSKTITVSITDDSDVEGSEGFTVELSNIADASSSAESISDSSGAGTITDDDKNVSLSIVGSSVAEAGGTASLTVSRSGDLSATTRVDYQTVDGSALAGTDFKAQTGQLVFAPGEASRTIKIQVLDDKIQELEESFAVALIGVTDSSGKSVAVLLSSADVAIIDDDVAGLVVSGDALVTSEAGRSDSFALQLASKPTAAVSITINGLDTSEGSLEPSQITFTPDNWNSAQTVTVTGVSDTLTDGDITYTLSLGSDSSDRNYAAGSLAATVTVTNKDVLSQFVTGITGDTVQEGGALTYQVDLSASSAIAQSHSLGFAGDAVEADYLTPQFSDGVSFDALTGTLTVPAGVSSFTVTVPTFDDRKVENKETLVLQIGARQADGFIIDNDVRPKPPVIVDVTETPTDPTPEDLLTGDTTQLLRVNGATGHTLRLYSSDGTLIPESNYAVTEIAPGVYEIDARGYELIAGDYVVRQVDRDGNESFDSNDFTVDSTPEVQDYTAARVLLPGSGMAGLLAVIDQNRVDLTDRQSSNPPQIWYDSDGEQAVFGVVGVNTVDGVAVTVAPSGSVLTLNALTGAYTYVPSVDAKEDVFRVTVRDPGGKGGNLDLTFEVRDLLDRDGIPGNTEDQLARLLTGGNSDLNSDGIDDSTQNAVATLAWSKQDNFTAAVSGYFQKVDQSSIITIVVDMDSTGSTPSPTAQLIGIAVLSNSNGSLVQTGLEPFVAPWDPMQFSVEPLQSLGLLDEDMSRPGIQQRVTIDISASGLREGAFDDYMKYISAETIRAAIEAGVQLVTPSGELLLSSAQAGWYSFMQTSPGGDGARYIIEDGYIKGIELILTDNAFGDVDFKVGRITDPGMPVALPDFTPPVITVNNQVIEYLNQDVPENTREVIQLQSDEPVLWQIVDGDDQQQFMLDRDGNLSFTAAPDFEKPTDSDANNAYQLTISAIDAAGNTTLIVTTVQVQNLSEAKPVFAASLAGNDRWLTGSLDDAYAHTVKDPGVHVEFYSLPLQEPGTLPLKAWVNSITGDYFYAPEGVAPPYACYVPTTAVGLGFVQAAGHGAFDVHLFMNDLGITQIVGIEQSLAMQLTQSGYRDYGALFASAEPLVDNGIGLIGVNSDSGNASF